MITEDYVRFETAKLLKEKGFDEITPLSYRLPDGFSQRITCRNSLDERMVSKVTLQMAVKWLREVHNLHVIALPYAPINRPPYHPGEADIVYIAQIFKGIIPIDEVGRSIINLSPEEAYEMAIKYCLENLI